jgi:hypothetical protein
VASSKQYYVTTNQAIAATAHLGNEALRTSRDLHQAAALAEVWHDDMNRLVQSLYLLLKGNLHYIDQRRQQLRDQIIVTLFNISLLDKLQQFLQDIQQSASGLVQGSTYLLRLVNLEKSNAFVLTVIERACK